MSANLLQNIASAEWIFNTAFQSLVILASGWLFMRFFKHKSAPLRSAVVIQCLILLAVLPLLNLPSLSLAPLKLGPTVSVKFHPSKGSEPSDNSISALEHPEANFRKGDTVSGQIGGTGRIASLESSWIKLINFFGLIWISVAAVFFLRFLKGTLSLRKLRKDSAEVDLPQIDRILAEALNVFPRTLRTRVYESKRVNTPMSLGFLKPYILLPASSIKKMSQSKLRGILIHELSHIYHRDHLLGVLQRLVTLLNWWNPLAFALSAALSRAREEISDNHVLLRNDSKEYARCLVELVEKTSFLKRHPVATAMASAHIPLKERVKLILSKERNMETRLKKSTFGWIVCTAFLFLVLVSGYRTTFAAIEEGDQTPPISENEQTLQEQSQSQEKQVQKTDPVRIPDAGKSPKLIKKFEPVYPEEARKAGIEGEVILEVTTDKDGLVSNVKVLKSIPALDDASVEAVKQWVYEPMIIDGKPHGIMFTVKCIFKLSDKDKKGVVGGVLGGVTGGVIGGVAGGVQGGVEGQVLVFGDFEKPLLVKKVDPAYPEEAGTAGIEGEVILEVTTDKDGLVSNVKVLKSIPALDDAAVEAVKRWVYEPYILDGKARSVIFPVKVRFKLK